MAMAKTRRHQRRDPDSPEAVAKRLPVQLRSFNAWYYTDNGMPAGLQDYLAALAAQVAPHEPIPVMNAAGLSVSDWYRHMLTRSTDGQLVHSSP
jgi:hypothetical protein